MWMQSARSCGLLCVILPCVVYAQGALPYFAPPPPQPSPSSGGALSAPYPPPAPQPPSQGPTIQAPAPVPLDSQAAQSAGLGTGAIAGIAVGSAVASIVALVVVLRCCCRRSHGHEMRSAGQNFVPGMLKSTHSSPWEKGGRPKDVAGNDKFISMLDVHTIREDVLAEEAGSKFDSQGGHRQAVPGMLTQKLDNTWRLAAGTIKICVNGTGEAEKLGGKVYKGRLRGSDAIAVKVFEKGPAKQQERIIRDIRIMKACMDSNIVRFMGAEFRTKHILLAMELLDCRLYTALRRDDAGKYGWDRRGKHITMNILHGLRYLHGLGIAHLGLTSHNILLDAEGRAKLANVGVGKFVSTHGTLPTTTGSPLWASPEQINGEVCSTKADIWAFGTILWEICSGDKLVKRSELTLAVPTQAPQEVADMLRLCLSVRPGDRPTAATIVAKLFPSAPPHKAAP